MLEVRVKRSVTGFTCNTSFKTDKAVLGLLGASGSGKSMTLKMISGLLKPNIGYIALDGHVLFDSENRINVRVQDRNIGYLFQDYALFPNMTAFENIMVGVKKGKMEQKKQKVHSVMEDLQISHLKERHPYQLSGGEKQRVALGRILVNDPKLILLDEPFSALDEHLRWQIEMEVKAVLDKYRIPAIIVSHSKDEVYRLCDEICIMQAGKSQELQETEALFRNPKTYAAALLSGCKNYSKIEKTKDGAFFATDWGIWLSLSQIPEDEDIAGIYSGDIELTTKPEDNGFELNDFIEQEELYFAVIMAKTPQGGYLRIEMDKKEWEEKKTLGSLWVSLKKDSVMLLKSY